MQRWIDVRYLSDTDFRALVLRYLEDNRNAMGKLLARVAGDQDTDGAESGSSSSSSSPSPRPEKAVVFAETFFPPDERQPS